MNDDEKNYIIETYNDMYTRLRTFTEEELLIVLNYEAVKYKRLKIIKRLYNRYSALRKKRELFELENGRPLL